MRIAFEHRQAAHCENGAAANLLRFHGLDLSEPLVFGVGAGLFFAYLPFITVAGAPAFSFRTLPGRIFSRAARQLGVRIVRRKFREQEAAMTELDRVLDRGIPVGCVVGVFHLPYFPPAYRFHFNAHNLVVTGREGNRYFVSDPIMEAPTELSREELVRVRFARGVFAPRGHMYHIEGPVGAPDIGRAVRRGIRETCGAMLRIPVPLFGVRGIRFLAWRMRRWRERLGDARAALALGQIVRMQEEIGTGGGGFRFIYAAFLQEAAVALGRPELEQASQGMTAIGDRWRGFALQASRIFKERRGGDAAYGEAADLLLEIADLEQRAFRELQTLVR